MNQTEATPMNSTGVRQNFHTPADMKSTEANANAATQTGRRIFVVYEDRKQQDFDFAEGAVTRSTPTIVAEFNSSKEVTRFFADKPNLAIIAAIRGRQLDVQERRVLNVR